jgi:hypothetical protein
LLQEGVGVRIPLVYALLKLRKLRNKASKELASRVRIPAGGDDTPVGALVDKIKLFAVAGLIPLHGQDSEFEFRAGKALGQVNSRFQSI